MYPKTSRWAWFPVLLGTACVAHSQTPPRPLSRPPQHVMSLSLCTDALLLDLLPPERIASVTYLAHASPDPGLAAKAARVGVNFGSAEEVLAEAPDLVLTGTFSTPAARALLQQIKAPMLAVPSADDFGSIRTTVRTVAQAVGAPQRGEQLLAQMDATLATVARGRPGRPIRVAAWSGDGYVPGRGTLFNTVLEVAGGSNVAATTPDERSGFVDIEQLLMMHPDVLAYGSQQDATPALKTDNEQHPLLLRLYGQRRITYPELFMDCGLPESADAALALQAQLLAVVRSANLGPTP
jgi:iron complex transport system substrate-binding protein